MRATAIAIAIVVVVAPPAIGQERRAIVQERPPCDDPRWLLVTQLGTIRVATEAGALLEEQENRPLSAPSQMIARICDIVGIFELGDTGLTRLGLWADFTTHFVIMESPADICAALPDLCIVVTPEGVR